MKRSRLKPFSFKATIIDKTGKGVTKSYNLPPAKKSTFSSLAPHTEREDVLPAISGFLTFDDQEPLNFGITNYEKRQITLNKKWTDIRKTVLKSFVKDCHMPVGQECVVCGSEPAVLKCEDCGSRQFYCLICGHSLHKSRNQFHVLELWKGRTFVPYFIEGDVLATHTCSSANAKNIVCIDEHGNQHAKKVSFCSCESAVVTLVRLRLWPATPDRPSTAFSFKLMDLVSSVFLHCKVSLKEFTECLESLRKPLHPRLVSSIYQLLNASCFEEYRFFKHQLSTLEMSKVVGSNPSEIYTWHA
ncbi:uncharacterized protein LOC110232517 [Exaiptasia diaphana]|uniref:CxC2-like cysteine cluster KDZ transposase-associated domain-containing protein n=1 Tax=Exaiptasia diaphana TaxID=2652724 RepID=A0A913WSF0_EXADI|nr:uncharacterized protein LOC110232517 [Exaiptasia diaphana]KXJ21046.1 hypothetical protein AC249_AIPGENE4381 [Exaiptasia diaphana]